MTEEWRVIEEFPLYSVSNYGRVKNNSSNHILVGGKDRDGYRQVTLQGKDKQYNRRVCRLVAITFIPNPLKLPQVNHKDENKQNDYICNLEWCTALYNNNYGTKTDSTKKKVRCIETQVVYNGLREAARNNGTSHSTIRRACLKKYKVAGYHWEFV